MLNVVAKLMVIVPEGILRLDDLVDEVAVPVLDGVAVFLAPLGVVFLKLLVLAYHSLKLKIKFRRVAETVEKFSQNIRNVIHVVSL